MAKVKVYTPPIVAIQRLVLTAVQTGTNAPVNTYLQNTLHQTTSAIVSNRVGVGIYEIGLPQNLPATGVIAMIESKDPSFTISINRQNLNEFLIETLPAQDGLIWSVIIEVYNQTNENI